VRSSVGLLSYNMTYTNIISLVFFPYEKRSKNERNSVRGLSVRRTKEVSAVVAV